MLPRRVRRPAPALWELILRLLLGFYKTRWRQYHHLVWPPASYRHRTSASFLLFQKSVWFRQHSSPMVGIWYNLTKLSQGLISHRTEPGRLQCSGSYASYNLIFCNFEELQHLRCQASHPFIFSLIQESVEFLSRFRYEAKISTLCFVFPSLFWTLHGSSVLSAPCSAGHQFQK